MRIQKLAFSERTWPRARASWLTESVKWVYVRQARCTYLAELERDLFIRNLICNCSTDAWMFLQLTGILQYFYQCSIVIRDMQCLLVQPSLFCEAYECTYIVSIRQSTFNWIYEYVESLRQWIHAQCSWGRCVKHVYEWVAFIGPHGLLIPAHSCSIVANLDRIRNLSMESLSYSMIPDLELASALEVLTDWRPLTLTHASILYNAPIGNPPLALTALTRGNAGKLNGDCVHDLVLLHWLSVQLLVIADTLI